MEIYLKITRDLYKQGTLQIGKETAHFNEKYFHFSPYFCKIKRLYLKLFYYSQKLCNTILYKISTIFAFMRRAASIIILFFNLQYCICFVWLEELLNKVLYNILIYNDKFYFES